MTPHDSVSGELIIQGALGRYQLVRYLGGGQTAAVYEALVIDRAPAARVGKHVAVKLMLPDLDEKTEDRFFTEADTLIQLRAWLKNLDLKPSLAGFNNDHLIPEVFDQVRKGPYKCMVMTLANGQPLDELLRHGWQEMSEQAVLTLFYQVLTVFVALHEGLQRSYLDFQPRNLFWDAVQHSATLVDWNLLSAPGRADPQHDLTTITRLFYHVAVGCAPAGSSPATLARPHRWHSLSVAMRELLLTLLGPTVERRPSARVIRELVGTTLAYWTQSADQLLIQGAELVAQMETVTDENHKRIQLRQLQIWVDLAERRGFSSYMAVVAQGLRTRLYDYEQQFSWVNRARKFLNAETVDLALATLRDALEHAATPTVQLTVWRWLTVTRAMQQDLQGYRAVAEELESLLTKLAAIEPGAPVDWAKQCEALHALNWPGTAAIETELQTYPQLQRLRALDEQDLQSTSPDQLAELLQTGEAARDALDKLPGVQEESSYAAAAWGWVGGEETDNGRQIVEDRLKLLRQRLATLAIFAERLNANLTPQAAAALVHHYHGDPYLVAGIVERCSIWLANPDNDGAMTTLLDAMLNTAAQQDQLQWVRILKQKLLQLHEAKFWLATLHIANQRMVQEMTAAQATTPSPEEMDAISDSPKPTEENEAVEPAPRGTTADQNANKAEEKEWQSQAFGELLLQTIAHLQRTHTALADLPGIQKRMIPLFEELAAVTIGNQHYWHTVEAVLQKLTPHLLPSHTELRRLARQDEDLKREIATLTNKQMNLEQQIKRLLEREQRIEQTYINRHQVLEDQYKSRQQELERQQAASLAAKEQHFQARQRALEQEHRVNQQSLTAMIQSLEQQRNQLREEAKELTVERSRLVEDIRAFQRTLDGLRTEQSKLQRELEQARKVLDARQREVADQSAPQVGPVAYWPPAYDTWSPLGVAYQLAQTTNLSYAGKTKMLLGLSKTNQAVADDKWNQLQESFNHSNLLAALDLLGKLDWHEYVQAEIVRFTKLNLKDDHKLIDTLAQARQEIWGKYEWSRQVILQKLQGR